MPGVVDALDSASQECRQSALPEESSVKGMSPPSCRKRALSAESDTGWRPTLHANQCCGVRASQLACPPLNDASGSPYASGCPCTTGKAPTYHSTFHSLPVAGVLDRQVFRALPFRVPLYLAPRTRVQRLGWIRVRDAHCEPRRRSARCVQR
eukprot:3500257-Pleurochrysis_carterae.AAC.1